MADNFGMWEALTYLRMKLRSTDTGGVHTLHTDTNVATVSLPTAIVNGQNAVAAAGTAEALAAATPLRSIVVIKALIGNTGNIFVGDLNVDSANGYVLAQGESVVLSIADLEDIFIDSAVDGDGVSFVGS